MIALVDCNSFYCSCERLFRPDLSHTPIVVLSNNDGCAVSRTDEAKALGVKMGQPFFEFKNLCNSKGLVVFSSNFALYTNLSDRVMGTLKDIAPAVEVYSVDEAFLDLSGIEINQLDAFGRMVSQTIMQNVGIPVGVGIGKTKVLAKVANRLAKKIKARTGGVVALIDEKTTNWALKECPIEDVWGIGRANTHKMKMLGIHTAYDLANYPNDKLILKNFTKVGLMIKHELQGIVCHSFGIPAEKKKEIMCSRTFSGVMYDINGLKEAIASYVSLAAEKMRQQGSYCSRLDIFFYTNPHNDSPRDNVFDYYKLTIPTLDTLYLIEIALKLVDRNFKNGFGYKKAGVKLSNFSDESSVQLGLFESNDSREDRHQLMRTIDKINFREGDGAIKSLACGVDNKAWDMNRNHKSGRYLTSWNGLPKCI